MPVLTTYPGVYLEEVSSGVRTISGVATSVTAFVGRALRGPTDAFGPVTINSFGEFERTFGGLWLGSGLGFAVRDFFQNGGSQAIVVRVYRAGPNAPHAQLDANTLALRAAWPGAWGDRLRVRIDHSTRPLLPAEAADSLFNLSVKDTGTGATEVFRNVSVTAGHPRRIDRVLETESTLVRVNPAAATPIPGTRPAAHAAVPAGQDSFSDAEPTRYSTISDPNGGPGSDGLPLRRDEISDPALEASKTGMYALLKADGFNLLCIPPHRLSADPDQTAPVDVEPQLIDEAAAFCRAHRAFLLVDPPYGSTLTSIATFPAGFATTNHAALYFPSLLQPNPLHDGQLERFAPCGAVAGIMARTDAERGVWKAPAGLDATLVGVPALQRLAHRCRERVSSIRSASIVCAPCPLPGAWSGARARSTAATGWPSEWKYVPVRRMALFIEETPVPRHAVGGLRTERRAALGADPPEHRRVHARACSARARSRGARRATPIFVKCDRETTTQDDINRGIVNILVGFAPLKPAEFVIIKIQQIAGRSTR